MLFFLAEYVGLLFPGRIVLLAPNLARPCLAAAPGAPTRPARGLSGFWIRQVFGNKTVYHCAGFHRHLKLSTRLSSEERHKLKIDREENLTST